MAVAVIYKTGTILAGQSLSSGMDCTGGAPVVLFLPVDWTEALLSYQISYDGGTNYRDMFDRNAKEIAVNVVAGTAVRLNPEWTGAALGAWLKVRSGSRVNPIPQAADRVFTLMVNTAP